MEDDIFSRITAGQEDASTKMMKEVVKNLFTDDRDRLLMITDLGDDDLIWATGFQAMLRFLVDDFIVEADLREKCYLFMEDIYKMRISRRRLGRSELFDALKSQNVYNMQEKQGLLQRLRGNRLP